LTNFIGEPTTVLFKKSLLNEGFGHFNGNSYTNIGDIATWFSLLKKGHAVYLHESLSYFRQHGLQNSQKPEVYLMGVIEWENIIADSYELKLITSEQVYKDLILKWFYTFNSIIKNIAFTDLKNNLKERLANSFKHAIDIILKDQCNKENTNILNTDAEISNKLVIFDDFFPNLLTGFRIAEYNYYLKNIKGTKVYSENPDYVNCLREYLVKYPEFKDQIHNYLADIGLAKGKNLLYTIFLNNIYRYLPLIEKLQMPFIFTLYPGGGLWLDQSESDYKLQKVCSSPYLKKVIVTQRNIFDYLKKKKFVAKDKIEFIYGGVFPSDYYKEKYVSKARYKKDKKTFDICFVAHKYMEKGLDKGYDIFIATCKVLADMYDDMNFHIVGGFDESDISIKGLENKIHFYGSQYKEFFPSFYSKMDIILSPNKSFVLYPGGFDGFPTGCCMEASFCGVAVFCTDDLNNNINFSNNEEICIINRDVQEIADKIGYYYNHIDELYELSSKGREKALNILDIEKQMEKRVKLIKQYM
jgi:glycosyltransferase involved in cell wall biosynthesis